MTVEPGRTRQPAIRDLGRVLVSILVSTTLVATLGVAPAAGASWRSCRVTNTDTGRIYSRLKPAVRSATPRDRLVVRGTCRGGAFINKDLVIIGRWSRRGKPILDGDDRSRVITVKPGVKVRLRDLTIQDGRARRGFGGAIVNRGKLRLRDVVVRRSRTSDRGGGIYNQGNLQLFGNSKVRSSLAGTGGGIYNEGIVRLSGSSKVKHSTAANGGGVYNLGTLRLRGFARIARNRTGQEGLGGGIYNAGTTTLKDKSRIRRNDAGIGGGAVNAGGVLRLADSSSVERNVARTAGGVSNDAAGTLQMRGLSTIRSNRATEVGGLDSAGTIVGVSCAPQSAANVYGNIPDDCRLR